MQYTLGALPSPEDKRDILISRLLKVSILPDDFSLEKGQSPIKYQGGVGSCVAHGGVAHQEFANGEEFNRVIDLSEEFLYWYCKQNDGIPNEDGTYPKVMLDILLKIGVCEERFWPYEDRYPPKTKMEVGAVENAAVYKIANYAKVNTDMYSVRNAIYQTGPVGIAINVYENFFSTGSDGVAPEPKGKLAGGHFMLAVGWKKIKGIMYLVVKNSWSISWGKDGYCLLSESFWNKCAIEAWTIIDAKTSAVIKHWSDWPDIYFLEQDIVFRKGLLKGVSADKFDPYANISIRQVALIAQRLGLTVKPKLLNNYKKASRQFVKDTIPGLTWTEERWKEPITRLQMVLLLARFITEKGLV